MAKTKSNRRRGGAKQLGNWSNAEHDARTAKNVASLNKKRRRQLERAAADDEEGDGAYANQDVELQPSTTKKRKEPHHELPLHQIRLKKKKGNKHRLTSHVPDDTYKRCHLAHDNYDQIDSTKLRLATAQTQRKVNALKDRLENWDPVEEARLAKQSQLEDKTSIEYRMKLDAQNRTMDREAKQKAASEYNLLYAQHGVNSSTNRRKANLKKNPRPGPESWKLRGAARPAHEVYDFDTRYVDVHMKARDEANAKARRVRNVIYECRGRFALDADDDTNEQHGNKSNTNGGNHDNRKLPTPQPQCREYLSLLTQLGSLQLHRKNYSSARKSFLEAIELEGTNWSTSITNARYQLMNMYLSTNRPSSARKLWNMLENDGSAWIKYSAALIEYVSWNLLQEEGSTAETAEQLLTQAIRGNVYVAYLLGWPDTFEKAMEYTDEVVERGLDSKGGSILEAIEYGCCCYSSDNGEDEEDKGMGMWLGTEGSLDWVRSVVLRVLNEGHGDGQVEVSDKSDDGGLTRADLLSWETKLSKEDEEFEQERNEREKSEQEGDEDEEEDPDVVMYAGMFRTAMDWLQDAGEFLKEPSYEYVSPTATDEGDEVLDVDTESRKSEKTNDNDGGASSDESGSESNSKEQKNGEKEQDDDSDSSSSSSSSTSGSDSD